MGLFDLFKKKEKATSQSAASFLMTITNAFPIKDKGVVLTGMIEKGAIEFGDIVEVNGNTYKVIGIEIKGKLIDSANAGNQIGLFVNADPNTLFQKGHIVTKGTKIINISQDSSENSVDKEGETVNFGNRLFSEDDRKKLKQAIFKYLPAEIDTVDAQKEILENLSAVMDISLVKLSTEFKWEIPEAMPEDDKKEIFRRALVDTILEVEASIRVFKTKYLISKVQSAKQEELYKAWMSLDFYVWAIKSEYTKNIQMFRDYIHQIILDKFGVKDNPTKYYPVKCKGQSIYIDSTAFLEWKKQEPFTPQYEFCEVISLTNKEPVLEIIEDGVKTREYCLQTESDEDFSGKYFHIAIRLAIQGKPALPVMQIDGFVSDTAENRNFTSKDIGYRMEGQFLACGGSEAKKRYEMTQGQDLPMKGLKYPGYQTPSNVRLLGICPTCMKSFAFHGYSVYMVQNDVAYSDDGLDACQINAYGIDKETWSYEIDGKTFRYYNSFNCPHCGMPYLDYKKYPENKVFGVSGCVHLGRKIYQL